MVKYVFYTHIHIVIHNLTFSCVYKKLKNTKNNPVIYRNKLTFCAE